MNENTGTDLIASELLGELKAENVRKSLQIQSLHKVIIVFALIILAIVAAFLVFMNQFELMSESYTSSKAEGVYALIDSDGNIIADDLTPEQIEGVMNGQSE